MFVFPQQSKSNRPNVSAFFMPSDHEVRTGIVERPNYTEVRTGIVESGRITTKSEQVCGERKNWVITSKLLRVYLLQGNGFGKLVQFYYVIWKIGKWSFRFKFCNWHSRSIIGNSFLWRKIMHNIYLVISYGDFVGIRLFVWLTLLNHDTKCTSIVLMKWYVNIR